MDYVLAGLDVPQLPEYFVAYDTLASAAAARARPLDELMKRHPQAAPELRQLAAAHAPGTLRWLPLRAPVRDMSVLIDASSGAVVRVVPLAPW
jgi:membrane carboxypeptidase/penicillin-binding protein PbpC